MDKKLSELREKTARKAHLEAVISELDSQKGELESKLYELKETMDSENADVEKLEKLSLTALFSSAIGKKDEKLDKERREAYTAKLKYDTAKAELEDVEYLIDKSRKELKLLAGCELKYKNTLKERAEEFKSFGGDVADNITKLEEKAAFYTKNINELKEAINAGQKAKAIAAEVAYKLDDAKGYSTWDIMGGGILADIAKHGALDEAQQLVKSLQIQLRSFKTELADVSITADFQVNVDGFMRTADWFFDGFFVDLEVRERISNAQNEISITEGLLSEALRNLDALLNQNLRDAEKVNKELEDLVCRADG